MTTRRKAAKPAKAATTAPAETPAATPDPIRVSSKGGETVLHLEGVVGVAQARRLHQLAARLGAAGRPVSVRCEHLHHLDCAAVQVLLALHETLRTNGAGLRMQHLPDSVQRTLRVAGLASVF
jgi:anti-anti-sigma factor